MRLRAPLLVFALSLSSSLALAQESTSTPAPAQSPTEPQVVVEPAPPQGLAPASGDEAPPPPRPKYVPHGFTMEVGLGLAFTSASSDLPSRERQAVGLAPLSLSIGGFLSPKVALMFRAAGTSYFREYPVLAVSGGRVRLQDELYQVITGFYGAVVQYWPAERVFVGGGAGAAIYGTNPFFYTPDRFLEGGFGLTARAGWVFWVFQEKHAFSVVAEAFPAFFQKSTVVGSAINLQWQLM